MSSKPINRITLFKIPNDEDQQKLLDFYKEMPQKAVKDGKPYILSVTAGPSFPDQRNQGFTIAVVSRFSSKEDMDYYDNGCAAHHELRTFARSVSQGFAMIYFQNSLE